MTANELILSAAIAVLAVLNLVLLVRVRRAPDPVNHPGDELTIGGRRHVLTELHFDLDSRSTALFTDHFSVYAHAATDFITRGGSNR